MNPRHIVFALLLSIATAVALSVVAQDDKKVPAKGSNAVQYEYAFLTESHRLKVLTNNEPSLGWVAPGEKLKVFGKDLREQLLKQMGHETAHATDFDLFNHLGSKGWELCSPLPLLPPNEHQANYVTSYVFKREMRESTKIGLRTHAEEDARDQQVIQGEWKLAEMQVFDPKFEKQYPPFNLVIRGDKMKYDYESGRKSEASKFELKPKADPKQINFSTGIDGEKQDRVGIYSISGNELRICFDTAVPVTEQRRPREFAAPVDSGKILMRFERVKK